jgi:UDP-N-acetylglucosamine 2-epimerase (non-hydrolysing)
MTIRVLSVFGTRPEAVKMAPVVKQLAQTPGIESRVCVTAQHRQMLDQVLDLFAIQPDYDLDLLRDDQSLAALSAAIFTHLDPILVELQPDWVLAQGDTTTVAITSLLTYYRRIHFGHVEAGLRTRDKWQPFPEEINRRVAGVVADLHFAPTDWARQNLLNEGVDDSIIKVTGNPVIDALNVVAKQPEPEEIKGLLGRLGIGTRELVLVTAHRLWKMSARRFANSPRAAMWKSSTLSTSTRTCRNLSTDCWETRRTSPFCRRWTTCRSST